MLIYIPLTMVLYRLKHVAMFWKNRHCWSLYGVLWWSVILKIAWSIREMINQFQPTKNLRDVRRVLPKVLNATQFKETRLLIPQNSVPCSQQLATERCAAAKYISHPVLQITLFIHWRVRPSFKNGFYCSDIWSKTLPVCLPYFAPILQYTRICRHLIYVILGEQHKL
jgi:hypothetical protein